MSKLRIMSSSVCYIIFRSLGECYSFTCTVRSYKVLERAVTSVENKPTNKQRINLNNNSGSLNSCRGPIIMIWTVTLVQHFIPSVVQSEWLKRSIYDLVYSQVKGFIEFRCPAVVLGFGGEFAFLVAEVRPDHRHLHEGTEHSRCLPPQIVRRHHWARIRSNRVKSTESNIIKKEGKKSMKTSHGWLRATFIQAFVFTLLNSLDKNNAPCMQLLLYIQTDQL